METQKTNPCIVIVGIIGQIVQCLIPESEYPTIKNIQFQDLDIAIRNIFLEWSEKMKF